MGGGHFNPPGSNWWYRKMPAIKFTSDPGHTFEWTETNVTLNHFQTSHFNLSNRIATSGIFEKYERSIINNLKNFDICYDWQMKILAKVF